MTRKYTNVHSMLCNEAARQHQVRYIEPDVVFDSFGRVFPRDSRTRRRSVYIYIYVLLTEKYCLSVTLRDSRQEYTRIGSLMKSIVVAPCLFDSNKRGGNGTSLSSIARILRRAIFGLI